MSYFGFTEGATTSSSERYFLDVPVSMVAPGLDCYPTVFPCQELSEQQQTRNHNQQLVGPWTYAGLETSSSPGETEPRYHPTGVDGTTTWAYLPSGEAFGANVGGGGGGNEWKLSHHPEARGGGGGSSSLLFHPVSVPSPLSSSESLNLLTSSSSSSSDHSQHNNNNSIPTCSSSPDPFSPSEPLIFPPHPEQSTRIKSKQNPRRNSSSSRNNNGILSVSERRARNKVASAKYRQKKNRKEAEMGVTIEILTERCKFLERQLKLVLRENEVLRNNGKVIEEEEESLKLFSGEMGLCL